MKPGSRRALLGVLSVGAVLIPAAGIAYLGAVSYQADRGIVAAKVEEHFDKAWEVAQSAEAEVRAALEATASAFSASASAQLDAAAREELAKEHPLASHPFRIVKGRLGFPIPDPLRRGGEIAGYPRLLPSAGRACPDRRFGRCIRDLMAARRRQKLLSQARRREVAGCVQENGRCRPPARALAEARRLYRQLLRHEDVAPEAILGLARLDRLVGDRDAARARYRELGRRFGGRRDADGAPYSLLATLGAAEVARDTSALLELFRRLVHRQFAAPSALLSVLAQQVQGALVSADLEAEAAAELEALVGELEAARRDARFAAALEGEVDDIWRSAGEQPRGRPAILHPERTLVFRRLEDESVVGLTLGEEQLGALVSRVGAPALSATEGGRAVVKRLGAPRPDPGAVRTLATASFGPLLPHLSLALVVDSSLPDPLDEIVRKRGQKHLLITGGLVLVLLVGVVATIRSAARERELARLKSDFVSTVSHELKTPLTSIRMFAEMLQQNVAGTDRERESRYHDIIVRESERLGLLIANLLDYSQVERGTRRYTKRKERAAGIAVEAVETFLRLRERENRELDLKVAEEAREAMVLADHDVVVQAMLNLLANAAKYGGADRPIEVRVEARADERVALSVRDHGPGIPLAEQSRIFREFYRAPSAYSSGVEGTGLGLALVKQHIEAHGGEIELQSEEGAGATFTILLPEVQR